MFRRINTNVICVEVKYIEDITTLIERKDVKTIGNFDIIENDKYAFITFNTKLKVDNIKKIIENKLYKAITDNRGNLIFVTFK